MKRTLTVIFVFLFIFHLSENLSAQAGIRRADRYFAMRAWVKAIPVYEKITRKKPQTVVYYKLGECYKQIGNYPLAEYWFGEAAKSSGAGYNEKLAYALMLQANGKYDQAKKYLEGMAPSATPDQLSNTILPLVEACEEVKKIARDSMAWKVFNTEGINSEYNEMCPAIFRRGIVFTSDRPTGGIFKFTNSATGKSFYDLFYTERLAASKFIKIKPFKKGQLNSALHDGPVTFSPAEDRAYITRSNFVKGNTPRDRMGMNRLTILSYQMVTGRWEPKGGLPFGDKEYTLQHPALSKDEKVLCFSSDMPGGYGGFDIYTSLWDNDAQAWSTPMNMGPEVNTASNEGYPCLVGDSAVYFSSDRPGGLGRLDIYCAEYYKSRWTKTRNAGPPMNSAGDDFGVVFEKNGTTGFFTSNRQGGKGGDDIYGFRRYKILNALVVDAKTKMPQPNLTIEILDVSQRKFTYKTDEFGYLRHYVTSGEDVFIICKEEGFKEYRQGVDMRQTSGSGVKNYTIELITDRKYILRGTVTDAATEYPLEGASIRLMGKRDSYLNAGRGGLYQSILEPNSDYLVMIGKEGYIPVLQSMSTVPDPEPRDYRIDGPLKKGNYILVEGIGMLKDSGSVMSGLGVRFLSDATGAEAYTTQTRKDGTFFAILPVGNYTVLANAPGCFAYRTQIKWDGAGSDTTHLELAMSLLGEMKVVQTVYHPSSQSSFDSTAVVELMKIVSFMRDNPDVHVELSSHTDARGSDAFNMRLSQQRAEKVSAFLLENGIDPARITAKGYGESQLANACGNGKTCEDYLHAQNRRTELRVLKIVKTPEPAPAPPQEGPAPEQGEK